MGEAPTAEMETVIITRGVKVLACLFGFLSFLLLITASGGTAWVIDGDAMPYEAIGLFEECKVTQVAEEDVEEQGREQFVCQGHTDTPAWWLACQALMIMAIVLSFISFVVVAVGLCSAVESIKFGCYRAGIYGYFICVFAIILTNIIFPVKYFQENGGEHLTLGWAYGLAWGLAVLLLAGALMLILDKGEELELREKMPDEEEG